MELETVKFELRDDGIGILTLNRPDRMNAISSQLVADLNEIFDHLMVNLDCRVVIMKGAGKGFCAGLDLKESAALSKRRVPEEYKKFNFVDVPELIKRTLYTQAMLGEVIIKMRKVNQPIIVLVQGPATGGGFSFAMAADIRLASEKGRFSIGAINIGMSGGDIGGSYLLPRLIGLSRAAEIMYTGRYLGAEEAKKIGFVLEIVDEDKLLDKGMEIAKNMLSKSPLGLRMTKEALNSSLNSPSLESTVKMDNRAQTICLASKDFAEAIQSFIEKRDPKFPLR